MPEEGGAQGSRRALDWLLRNRRTGGYTIGQAPNLALWVFLASRIGLFLLHLGPRIEDLVSVIGTVALLWWSVDEIIRGVNPFRRLLGLVVLALISADLAR
jgi:hypothetical protein